MFFFFFLLFFVKFEWMHSNSVVAIVQWLAQWWYFPFQFIYYRFGRPWRNNGNRESIARSRRKTAIMTFLRRGNACIFNWRVCGSITGFFVAAKKIIICLEYLRHELYIIQRKLLMFYLMTLTQCQVRCFNIKNNLCKLNYYGIDVKKNCNT